MLWAYEWVVYRDGRTWAVLYADGSDLGMSPVIYTKVAVGFLSLYDTSFAKGMTVYLEQTLPDPTNGYCEGVDEDGAQIDRVRHPYQRLNCGRGKIRRIPPITTQITFQATAVFCEGKS